MLIVSVASYGFHNNWSTLTHYSSWTIFRYRDVFENVRSGLETSCIVGMQIEWLDGFLVDFCPVGRLSGCLLGCSDDWMSGYLLGSLLGWLAGCLLVWMVRATCQGKYCYTVLQKMYKKCMQIFDKVVWKWRKNVAFTRRREIRWSKSCT